ncbi:TetR/AcrR family transcriptional regulator [Oryzifoliimicrobium ureilyticus]|uniref:TetR/AcrR family transcriptional regulator n=1 Tax=Oryzifoliimicrobium ureilyticus TaxID=3113724 RepID=UPI0030760B32
MHPEKRIAERPPGRPREFEADQALDSALVVFSERGYQAASIHELGLAMKLTSGSLYKAFGDKRGVYLAAIDRYLSVRRRQRSDEIAKGATGRDKLERLLAFFASSAWGETGRLGCIVVGAATEIALFDQDLADRIRSSFERDEAELEELIRIGQSDGSIAPDSEPEALACSLLCLTKGMRVVGKTGRTHTEMNAVVTMAMKLLS